MSKFKVGDVVEFGGVRGAIVSLNSGNPKYPLQALFVDNKKIVGFDAEGVFKLEINGEEVFKFPLKFVKRPKMKLGVYIKLKIKELLRKIFGLAKKEEKTND